MLIFLCVTKSTVCRDDTKTNMTDRCIASSLEWQWLGAGRLVYSLTAFQWSLSLSFVGDGVSFNLVPCASQLLFCCLFASIMYERVPCTFSACGGAFSFGDIFVVSFFLPSFLSFSRSSSEIFTPPSVADGPFEGNCFSSSFRCDNLLLLL